MYTISKYLNLNKDLNGSLRLIEFISLKVSFKFLKPSHTKPSSHYVNIKPVRRIANFATWNMMYIPRGSKAPIRVDPYFKKGPPVKIRVDPYFRYGSIRFFFAGRPVNIRVHMYFTGPPVKCRSTRISAGWVYLYLRIDP